MTSVIAQVEASVASEHSLPAQFVGDEVQARPTARAGSRAWTVGLWPGADGVATLVTLGVLNLLHVSLPVVVAAALPALWPAVLAGCGGYAPTDDLAGAVRLGPVWRAGSTLGFVALAAIAVTDLAGAPASLLLLTVAVMVTTAVLRIGTGRLLVSRSGRRTVVAGTYDQVRQVLDELRHDPRHGLEVVAVCLPDEAGQDLFDIPVTVGIERIGFAVETSAADAVIVQPSPDLRPEDLRRLGWQLEARGTSLFLGTGMLDVAPARTTVSRLAGLHVVRVRPARRLGPRRAAKELWERGAAALLLLVLSPVLLGVALLVRLDSPGPAIFRQRRVGRDGRVFVMLKFRTMTTDAETLAAGLLDHNDCDGVLFKMHRDPRITRAGRVLRRYSLDELPQLLNVAGGQMALVGPRPALPKEVDRYDHDPRRRLAVKPGLTGLWQVSGRSDLSWDESVRLDLLYVDNWSLALDLSIMARTAGAVLRARGAY
ncbi:MAG: sugar transferase [Nocardioides sp.]